VVGGGWWVVGGGWWKVHHHQFMDKISTGIIKILGGCAAPHPETSLVPIPLERKNHQISPVVQITTGS
jgi:hypothetical protein